DLDAGVARPAGIGRRPVHAVQRAREDARRRRLADAARAGEDERVGEAPARQRVAQRARDGRLADDVVETLRAPLAGEDLIGHTKTQLKRGCSDGLNRGPEWLRHTSGST